MYCALRRTLAVRPQTAVSSKETVEARSYPTYMWSRPAREAWARFASPSPHFLRSCALVAGEPARRGHRAGYRWRILATGLSGNLARLQFGMSLELRWEQHQRKSRECSIQSRFSYAYEAIKTWLHRALSMGTYLSSVAHLRTRDPPKNLPKEGHGVHSAVPAVFDGGATLEPSSSAIAIAASSNSCPWIPPVAESRASVASPRRRFAQ
ncbi:hypothetical protein DAEQUDRAFT_359936 [Daedalea quercina L-15889]|uniref:Uncharacterized protein n=1 Tax=Daedalea quercina L-15889 TaxID=1314783 RepID=A0A165TSU7_9APHY|nr:hypothetical protein DAEQUDRAFT_359936 [Daedalea quercina L-15889]